MVTVDDLTLAEAVALVGGFALGSGKGIQPGLSSHGNIFLAERASLLIGLADEGCIRLEHGTSSQLVPGAATARVVVVEREPEHPLLRAAYQAIVKQAKPMSADRLMTRIGVPVHERLVSSDLVARSGRLVRRESLTPEGLRLRAELWAEIDGYLAPDAAVDAAAISERTALIVAVLLAGLIAQPLYAGRRRPEAIESERRLMLLRARVSTEGELAPGRTRLLAALSLANAGFVT